MNTMELLEAVKVRRGIASDYALAKALGVSQPTVASYRAGNSRISDDVALTVAEILHLHPLQVIAAANAERAKTPEQKARWTDLMEKFSVSFRSLLSQWDGRERRMVQRSLMQ
ncbi:helix-turn-helix domain-containing protein [Massilia timonae]|uniref:helix-turn-helix domain-containing protein n=1 Tax=Massilia timonae TaxID=47229 RepID=UPI0028D6CE26|nr:helix-turn-helix domain-containing protein [Massilia timonae]